MAAPVPDPDRDPDLDAAERALGTMPRDVESLDGARRRRDWETRLAPLAELVAPVAPPDALLGRIVERIADMQATRALSAERRRAARWRGAAAALAVAAVAAVAVALLGARDPAPLPGAPGLVSVATASGGPPALVISLDEASGVATVRPVDLAAPAQGSFELWHIPAGGAPVSLGLVDPSAPIQVALRAAPGDVAAVSLEPAGGSPTGQPTGPVLYTGPFLSLR